MQVRLLLCFLALVGLLAGSVTAADWPRFRGPNGSAISDNQDIPTTWNDDKNIAWKVDLPGPGSSSPITTGPYVIVTCYTGYGVDRAAPGELKQLERKILCFERSTGKQVWAKSISAKLPEDPYQGFIGEHGYASHTPVTDGTNVYAFFGKSGVFAFDLTGKQLWQVDVGSGSAVNGWGSGTSLALDGDLVFVNADAEGQAIIALDKTTGREVWRASSEGYKGSWSTPVLLKTEKRTELIVAMPGEIWGLDPKDGGLLWFCEAGASRAANASPVVHEGVAYVINGGPGGSSAIAVRGGGKGDVAKSHVVWTTNVGSYVPSPVVHQQNLVWVDDRGVFHGLDLKSGKETFRERLSDAGGVYASVVGVGDYLIAVTRRKGTFVLQTEDKLQQVAKNVFASDDSDFNASPAIHDGQLFLRSNERLYCISEK